MVHLCACGGHKRVTKVGGGYEEAGEKFRGVGLKCLVGKYFDFQFFLCCKKAPTVNSDCGRLTDDPQ